MHLAFCFNIILRAVLSEEGGRGKPIPTRGKKVLSSLDILVPCLAQFYQDVSAIARSSVHAQRHKACSHPEIVAKMSINVVFSLSIFRISAKVKLSVIISIGYCVFWGVIIYF